MNSIKNQIKRGEIYVTRNEHLSYIPAGVLRAEALSLVLQNDVANQSSQYLTIAPVIYNFPSVWLLPTRIPISLGGFSQCVVLLDNILTIPKSQLVRKIGTLTLEELKQVEHGMNVALGVIEFSYFEEKQVNEHYRYKLGSSLPLSEDTNFEFKEIKGNNPTGSISSNIAEYTAAFLNSLGGTILYGISDSGIVRGVKADNKEKDDIKKTIHSNISNIHPQISPEHYTLRFNQVFEPSGGDAVPDLYVVEVVVPPSPRNSDIYFVKGTELHIRVDGVKKKLTNSQIVEHIRKKTNELNT
ncbi:putative DNA binding domain-containing protein [Paenibacillus sp. CC-CFT742]|nr:RNA-binding domain-containing protein [Paenibacillus sp. CC-CFT742]WJH30482.1 putative DNA binding domain-containing protein [Paenibacillus sp. CC-CFT742]